MSKKLVTSALPYANGRLHIGHVAGAYLPADIFVRFSRLKNEDVLYICGTDEHGAPITISAEAEGVSPQDIVNRYHNSIKQSFDGLGIEFDNFSGTARPEHHKLAKEFFLTLLHKGFISTNTSKQYYCEHDKRWLPDRYVEGICPHCKADGARGDQCDACGKLIDAELLIEPKCKICGNTPELKNTKHWYLDLPKFEANLKKWLSEKTHWKDNVHNFISSWLENGLIERAITRDLNWGVEVPNEEGKVLYVWFDAPIGYISATIEWAKKINQPEKWKEYWFDSETKLYHFIGKDNIPFHTIIWPAMLMEQEKPYIMPYDVPANEYLSLEGKKISTSRNYAIWVEEFLHSFDGELLRYYLAANAPENKDSDFTYDAFKTAVNNELANVLGNLANRVFSFAKKHFNGVINKPNTYTKASQNLFLQTRQILDEIISSYDEFKVRKATKLIMDIARSGNKYFDEAKPWVSIKEDKSQAEETLYVCSQLLRYISIVFTPVMPKKMLELRKMLNLDEKFDFDAIKSSPASFTIGEIAPLFLKLDDKLIEAEKEKLHKVQEQQTKQAEPKKIEHKANINFEDFTKLELRVVKIVEAEKIKKAKKLLKVKVKLKNETKTVLAGVAKSYSPEELIGKNVVMLLNLEPRKMMGEVSEGMLLAAEDEGTLSLLTTLNPEISDGSGIS